MELQQQLGKEHKDMAIAKKETYVNGDTALDLYEDGRIFITVDHVGMFITYGQIIDLEELLIAFKETAEESANKLLEALDER